MRETAWTIVRRTEPPPAPRRSARASERARVSSLPEGMTEPTRFRMIRVPPSISAIVAKSSTATGNNSIVCGGT